MLLHPSYHERKKSVCEKQHVHGPKFSRNGLRARAALSSWEQAIADFAKEGRTHHNGVAVLDEFTFGAVGHRD